MGSDPIQFLEQIFGNESGSLWLARIDRSAPPQHMFRQFSYSWPNAKSRVAAQIRAWFDFSDVYFCPHLFNGERRKSEVANEVTAAWADLDGCDPSELLVQPSLVWQTSPGRHQAVWIFDKSIPATEASHISKRIAYFHAAQGCDKSGHDITQLLRVPGTRNHKYPDLPTIEVVESTRRLLRTSDFDIYPDVERTSDSIGAIEGFPEPVDVHYVDLPYLVLKVFLQGEDCYTKSTDYDRSRMVLDLINVCRREGLTKGETASLLEAFDPFLGRINDDGVGWLVKAKLFNKADTDHPHEGKRCVDVDCPKASDFDKASLIRIGDQKWHF